MARVQNVGRQRGMVALLSSSDLTLDPTDEGDTTRVGENQLPSFVRDEIERTIAHTFKYADTPPTMAVAGVRAANGLPDATMLRSTLSFHLATSR